MFSELRTKSSWSDHRYAQTFDLSWDWVPDRMERVDCRRVSPEEFIRRFEEPYLPAVITGVMDNWPAKEKWTVEVRF